MKDIDAGLRAKHGAEPRRGLSNDFADHVMTALENQERRLAFGRLALALKGLTMHKLTKPASIAFSLAAAVITVGTGYAAVQWMRPDVKIDTARGIETLANGDKRFWVQFGSCMDERTPHASYYEIKAGSKLTPEMLTEGLTASCESDLLNERFPEISRGMTKGHFDFKPYQDQFYMPYVQVTDEKDGSLYVTVGLNGKTYTDVPLPVDGDARFYEMDHQIELSQIHKGDWLTLVAHTNKLAKPFSTETMTPDQLAPLMKDGLPLGATVHGAVKHEANPFNVGSIYQMEGTDWTRLEQDKSAPGGWRQIVPLNRDQK